MRSSRDSTDGRLLSPEGSLQTYRGAMPLSAHSVAAEIRRRDPSVGIQKLHKLLYYCQGHHLAATSEPLFAEPISAWDRGPVVGSLWKLEQQGVAVETTALSEAELNTVGYVLSRYGRLTGKDLEHLTHAEGPWQTADASRRPGESQRIDLDWIRKYFASEPGDAETPGPDSAEVTELLSGAEDRLQQPASPDSREAILARLGA
jgi:uncharacterized phage-associated protein